MRRVETIAEGITLFLGDCRELLDTVGAADAVVTDPPYGIADLWKGGSGHGWETAQDDDDRTRWDMSPPSSEFLCSLVEGRPSIVWGGNYYELPPQRGWLVYDKIVRQWTTGHCELAWTSLDQPIRAFNYSHGQMATEGKLHPTQKPVPLMEWCLGQLPENCITILDPYMGSGSTGVAAVKRGKQFKGIERVERYFDIACKRIADATKQTDLFIEKPKPVKQEAML